MTFCSRYHKLKYIRHYLVFRIKSIQIKIDYRLLLLSKFRVTRKCLLRPVKCLSDPEATMKSSIARIGDAHSVSTILDYWPRFVKSHRPVNLSPGFYISFVQCLRTNVYIYIRSSLSDVVGSRSCESVTNPNVWQLIMTEDEKQSTESCRKMYTK